MRSSVFAALVVFVLFAPIVAWADALEDAKGLIAKRQYDEAIAILEKLVFSGGADARIYYELGKAYNWKKDWENALKNYRQAMNLDPKKYATATLPVLDHFGLYDEIIRIGEAEFAKKAPPDANFRFYVQPSTLSALLDAYYNKKNTQQYQRVLQIIKAQQYSDSSYDAK